VREEGKVCARFHEKKTCDFLVKGDKDSKKERRGEKVHGCGARFRYPGRTKRGEREWFDDG